MARLSRSPGAAVIVPLGVVGAGLLAVLAVLGLYVRPAADDYCFASGLRDWGPRGFVMSFWTATNGRIVNGLVLAPLYGEAQLGLRVFPAVLLTVALIMTTLVIRGLVPYYGLTIPPVPLMSAAVVTTATSFGAITNTYQSLLWAPGAVTHSLPPLLALGVVTWATRSRRASAGLASVLGLVTAGFLIGLISEVVSMVTIAAVAAVLLLQTAVMTRLDQTSARLAAYALGSAGGLIAILLSPGSRHRQAVVGGDDRVSLAALSDIVHRTAQLTWRSFRPSVCGLVLTGLVVAWAAWGEGVTTTSRRRAVLLALMPATVSVAACTATMTALRLGLGATGYLSTRAYSNFFFLLCLAALSYGLLFGMLLGRYTALARERWAVTVSALAGGAALLCMLPMLNHVLALDRHVVVRARQWDAQDARIRTAVAAGDRQPVVAPLGIARVATPYRLPESRDWLRACITSFYQARRVLPPNSMNNLQKSHVRQNRRTSQ